MEAKESLKASVFQLANLLNCKILPGKVKKVGRDIGFEKN